MNRIRHILGKIVVKLLANFGYQLIGTKENMGYWLAKTRTEVDCRELLPQLGIPSLPLISVKEYHKICPPLFPQPQFIPNEQLKLIENTTLEAYFDVNRSTDGATIQDLAYKAYDIRQRMFMTAYLTIKSPPMSKLSFLDIGCRSGYFSFHADRLGFEDVLGVDARPVHEVPFNEFHRTLSLKCRFETLDVMIASDLPKADVVLCTGVLYHLTDHVAAIFKLRAMTKRLLVLTTCLNGRADNNSSLKIRVVEGNISGSIRGVNNEPSICNVIDLLRLAGFSNIRHIKDPRDPREPRLLSGTDVALIAE